MKIAKSRENNTSVFNEWHLCNDQLEKHDVNRLKHWQMMFKFLSDREYALSQILTVHQFLSLMSNTLAEIQEQLFLFLHYYNVDNKQSQATKHTMHKNLIDYTQNEINIKLKKIYGQAFTTDILVRILFILSCLWDSDADNNPCLIIQFMNMKEREATVGSVTLVTVATRCNALQHVATRCDTLQQVATLSIVNESDINHFHHITSFQR